MKTSENLMHSSDHIKGYQRTHCHVRDITTAINDTSNGDQQEDKRARKSTTKVSFHTTIIRLSQCMTAMTV